MSTPKIQISQEDIDNIRILTKYPEFGSLENLFKQQKERINKIDTVGGAKCGIEAEVIGRQWGIEIIDSILNEIERFKSEPTPKKAPDYE